MALTLLEGAKAALGRDQDLEAAVMMTFAESSDILQNIRFRNINGNALKFAQEETLPSIAFRGVNEAYTTSEGKVHNVTETLMIAGGDLDVDTYMVNTLGYDVRAEQERMKMKALSLEITKVILKGSHSTNTKEFDGLQARLQGSQLIAAGSTPGGDALSLYKLDEAISEVVNPTHLIMNKYLKNRLSQASRNTSIGGFIQYSENEFGKPVMMYQGLPILTVLEDSTGTPILPFNETGSGGGTAQCSSIYCVSFDPDGVIMLQNGDPRVTDLGELNAQSVYRTRVEWYLTLALLRKRCASRIYGITNAAVTA